MPVEREVHVTRRYAPYGHSAGVRHRGPKALARYGPRAAASKRKRRAAKNAIVAVPMSKLAFPSGMRTKLRFVYRHTFNVAAADNIGKISFLANSLTDPVVATAGNHQPRGFDEFMNVYRTYTVVGSKISVNFMYQGYDGPTELDNDTDEYLIQNIKTETNGANAPALTPLMCGIHKGVTDIVVQSSSQVMEQDRTVWKAMTPQDGAIVVSTAMRTSDFFGKDALVGAEGYTGSIGDDADNTVFYVVWCGRASGRTEGTVHAMAFCTIEYDVYFSEPKTLGQS